MRRPHSLLLIAVFTAIAVALAFPDVGHLDTCIPGDSGDALFNLWILRSVQAGVPHGWRVLWNAPIFVPALQTLAYSDALLPVALIHWPLRLVAGDALASNFIYLASWVLCSWCTYRLASRVTQTWGAAFVAALAFTYASTRLVHHQHFQLVVGGAFVPLMLLTFLRCLSAPSTGRGVAAGVSFAAVALTSSYYGAMSAIMLVVVAAGWLVLNRPASTSTALAAPARLAGALSVATAVAAMLVVPVARQYIVLQRQPEFRRTFDPASGAHFGDFLATAPGNYLLAHVPPIAARSTPARRGIENRLFPGFVALIFGAVGAGVLLTGARRQHRERERRKEVLKEVLIVVLAGAVALVLAFGDRYTFGAQEITLPFSVLRQAVPGFAGIRATARFALGGELALALLAAVGLDRILGGQSVSRRFLFTLVASAAVVAESAMSLSYVRVPALGDDGGVAEMLRAKNGGVVLELPIRSGEAGGAAWPFVEAPRQLAAVEDGYPRVNGYSGFEPVGFAGRAALLNHFPAPEALAEARRIGVRFVVLRTALVGTLNPADLTPQLEADGVGRYADETARRMLAGLAGADIIKVDRLAGAYLVELRAEPK
jgi:hypothetical protein